MADGLLEGYAEDAIIVPVAIDYETVPEANSYAGYMLGGAKVCGPFCLLLLLKEALTWHNCAACCVQQKSESLTVLFNAAREQLAVDHGNVWIRLGHPLSLAGMLRATATDIKGRERRHTESSTKECSTPPRRGSGGSQDSHTPLRRTRALSIGGTSRDIILQEARGTLSRSGSRSLLHGNGTPHADREGAQPSEEEETKMGSSPVAIEGRSPRGRVAAKMRWEKLRFWRRQSAIVAAILKEIRVAEVEDDYPNLPPTQQQIRRALRAQLRSGLAHRVNSALQVNEDVTDTVHTSEAAEGARAGLQRSMSLDYHSSQPSTPGREEGGKEADSPPCPEPSKRLYDVALQDIVAQMGSKLTHALCGLCGVTPSALVAAAVLHLRRAPQEEWVLWEERATVTSTSTSSPSEEGNGHASNLQSKQAATLIPVNVVVLMVLYLIQRVWLCGGSVLSCPLSPSDVTAGLTAKARSSLLRWCKQAVKDAVKVFPEVLSVVPRPASQPPMATPSHLSVSSRYLRWRPNHCRSVLRLRITASQTLRYCLFMPRGSQCKAPALMRCALWEDVCSALACFTWCSSRPSPVLPILMADGSADAAGGKWLRAMLETEVADLNDLLPFGAAPSSTHPSDGLSLHLESHLARLAVLPFADSLAIVAASSLHLRSIEVGLQVCNIIICSFLIPHTSLPSVSCFFHSSVPLLSPHLSGSLPPSLSFVPSSLPVATGRDHGEAPVPGLLQAGWQRLGLAAALLPHHRGAAIGGLQGPPLCWHCFPIPRHPP